MTTPDIIAYAWSLLPQVGTLVGIAGAAFAGERTAHKFLKATCQIVFVLAEKPLENHEKRQVAVDMLYKQFPVMSRIVPNKMLGRLVDIAWDEVIKPVAKKA